MRNLLALVLLGILVFGAWWFTRTAPRAGEAAVRADAPVQPIAEVTQPRARPDDPAPARAHRLRDGTARREAMQRQIVAAMAAREAAAGTPRAAGPTASDPARGSRSRAQPLEDAPAGALVDRTGNHAYLTRVLSQDLMPLVDECHALVRDAHPDLAGMLVLDLEIFGDEDIGGVINTLEPGKGNQIAEPALLECVRESLLATTLPPPEQGGRDAVSLSMRFDPPASE